MNTASYVEIRPLSLTGPGETLCAACAANELGLCGAFIRSARDAARSGIALEPSEHVVKARRVIAQERDLCGFVPFICEGWAACSVLLPDGRRQILSFLLPGDMVSSSLLFEEKSHSLVEAITDVRYRSFKRNEIKTVLFSHPSLIERLARYWIDEKTRSDQLALDLGRRSAQERIARLIRDLFERLTVRGMVEGNTMDFPLRQTHIADATGLTSVHVSKVLSELRRTQIININDRSLSILDMAALKRLACVR